MKKRCLGAPEWSGYLVRRCQGRRERLACVPQGRARAGPAPEAPLCPPSPHVGEEQGLRRDCILPDVPPSARVASAPLGPLQTLRLVSELWPWPVAGLAPLLGRAHRSFWGPITSSRPGKRGPTAPASVGMVGTRGCWACRLRPAGAKAKLPQCGQSRARVPLQAASMGHFCSLVPAPSDWSCPSSRLGVVTPSRPWTQAPRGHPRASGRVWEGGGLSGLQGAHWHGDHPRWPRLWQAGQGGRAKGHVSLQQVSGVKTPDQPSQPLQGA